MNGRSFQVRQRLRPAMLALRDAEDWARLELRDDLLATRIREVYESLAEDVLNGSAARESSRWKAKLWDRYALLRRHDADAAARMRSKRLRRDLRPVAQPGALPRPVPRRSRSGGAA